MKPYLRNGELHFQIDIVFSRHLFSLRKGCIETMSGRIKEMRTGLRERLEKLGTPGNWEHITNQIGMFSYTGLTGKKLIFLLNLSKIN